MIVKEVEIVINCDFGGFSLDTEMAIWLMEMKGWTVTEEPSMSETDHYDLFGMGDFFWPTAKHTDGGNDRCDTSFRMNPDLIECVKALQDKYKELLVWQRLNLKPDHKVLSLGIAKLRFHVDVVNEYDGKEEVKCWVTETT
jgi:hypothetical protein